MNTQQTVNIQVDVNPQIHQNCEFKTAYEHFERLLSVDDSYFSGLNVGEMRHYRFKNGDAIVYSLVSETFENGIKNYVIEIKHFVTKEVWEALKQHQGLFQKCWRILQCGVERAANFDFYIQIAIAIGVLSILLASKIASNDLPKIKTPPSVPEQQAPKFPHNKSIER